MQFCKLCFGSAQLKTNVEGSKFQFKEKSSRRVTCGESGKGWYLLGFSALSFLESEIMRINKTDKPILLSEMFIVHKAYEAKEKYIRMVTPILDKGAFHDIPYVIKNYGIVPQNVYTGLKKKSDTYNHSEMFKKLNDIVSKAK